MTEFGTLNPDGSYVHTGTLRQSDMANCPYFIMVLDHYRPDGTCRCDDPIEQARMIAEWGYSPSDFADHEHVWSLVGPSVGRCIWCGIKNSTKETA